MIDRHGRSINTLRLSVTDRCNLRCRYCLPHEDIAWLPRENMLRYEEIVRVVRVLARLGIEKVRVTGGEPLLRRDCAHLIGELAAIDGIRRVNLTTNGMLLERFADDLKRAGVHSVNISIDSLAPERFARITGGGALDRVLRGLQAVHERGFASVKINCVVMAGENEEELGDFAALTRSFPFHVRFIEYMPEGSWDGERAAQVVAVARMIEIVGASMPDLEPDHEASKEGVAVVYRQPGSPGTIGFISPVSDRFCERCNRVRITAEGQLKGCLLTEEYLDLRVMMRQGAGDEELAERLDHAIFNKAPRHEYHRHHMMNVTGG